ncbi:MAG: FAD-binding oxidoreductase [Alphaproteobacteria bacterium]|nr:FAD-binding oxidoreductase [Alphaproteobacteria bacterium]
MTTLKADVAIIGGGLAGCSTALHLRQRGAAVVLLERALCGSQASGVNYGGVRQQGRTLVELPLARRSRALWGRMAEIVGTDCEFMVSGHLKLARSEADMAELEAYATQAADWGLDLQLMGRNAIRDRYPWAGEMVIGGSLCADDGQANPRLVAPAFARRARALGADIREHAHVTHVEKGSDGFRLTTAGGLEVSAPVLINVAGAWGHEIAARFGENVPEEAISPNMCVTEPVPYFLEPNLGVVGGDLYMRQIPRGNIIFGGGRGVSDAAAQRARPEPDSALTSFQRAIEVAPALRHVQIIRNWTGIEGNMPDELPIIDISRTTPGLVHAFGFSGHGFQLGPAVGAVVAELALDGRTATAIEPFGIGRFAQAPPA